MRPTAHISTTTFSKLDPSQPITAPAYAGSKTTKTVTAPGNKNEGCSDMRDKYKYIGLVYDFLSNLYSGKNIHRCKTAMLDVETVKPGDRILFAGVRSEEHTSELQSRPHLVCRLLLEKKK